MPRTRIASITLIVLALGVACSDAPRSVPVNKPPPGAGSAAGNMQGELPPNHPPIDSGADHPEPDPDLDPSAQFGGKVILAGEFANKREGAVFISIRIVGAAGPIYSNKIDLGDPKLTAPVLVDGPDGTRELHFVLNTKTSIMPSAGVPKDMPLELHVLFAPGGFVDTKEGQVSAVTPAKSGDANLVLTLPPKT